MNKERNDSKSVQGGKRVAVPVLKFHFTGNSNAIHCAEKGYVGDCARGSLQGGKGGYPFSVFYQYQEEGMNRLAVPHLH